MVNAVQNTQQHLATQIQQMQVMMQATQVQYSAGHQNAHQGYGGVGTTVDTQIVAEKDDVVHNAEEIDGAAVKAVSTRIKHITVGPMECELIQ